MKKKKKMKRKGGRACEREGRGSDEKECIKRRRRKGYNEDDEMGSVNNS